MEKGGWGEGEGEEEEEEEEQFAWFSFLASSPLIRCFFPVPPSPSLCTNRGQKQEEGRQREMLRNEPMGGASVEGHAPP